MVIVAFNEVDVIDLRHYKAGTLYEYIEESNPDLVTMCLNGNCVTIDDFFDTGIKEKKAQYITDQIFHNPPACHLYLVRVCPSPCPVSLPTPEKFANWASNSSTR